MGVNSWYAGGAITLATYIRDDYIKKDRLIPKNLKFYENEQMLTCDNTNASYGWKMNDDGNIVLTNSEWIKNKIDKKESIKIVLTANIWGGIYGCILTSTYRKYYSKKSNNYRYNCSFNNYCRSSIYNNKKT